MHKKMKKLEKESMSWKTRFDGCNKALIDMVADVRHIHVYCFHLLYSNIMWHYWSIQEHGHWFVKYKATSGDVICIQ